MGHGWCAFHIGICNGFELYAKSMGARLPVEHMYLRGGFGKLRSSKRVALEGMVAGCHDSEETHGDGSGLHGLDRASYCRQPGPRTVARKEMVRTKWQLARMLGRRLCA